MDGESETVVAHDYGNNDDTYNDTISKHQVNINNENINLDEYNNISPIKHKVNKEYQFWKTSEDFNTDFSHNNNHIQDHENNYDDNHGVHSENIDSNL